MSITDSPALVQLLGGTHYLGELWRAVFELRRGMLIFFGLRRNQVHPAHGV